ncbi:dethiobiotin synthase [Maritalea porphyrae]|uniref:ATP-dependent dethiobiotin synthetase BioD n=1 Tax=Maritalea porphyrae TaxID=880732 RepID=A0ABQ5UUU7_9HYPH|nr:dethiobiotin synthase [Maritalea porphyrae]GLQ18186.1 ATP-dependent dethiobiotin synthetase BioD [Maritalea porphyrae]
MANPIVVTGTDTGIGKTIFSAGLTQALGATYWKPVQAGLEEATDSEIVAKLSGRPTLPETYRLKMPASPHLAAEAEHTEIDIQQLEIPQCEGVLVVEGAGGIMVPLNRKKLYLDMFAHWNAPVVLCARTQLGTINHSLMSIHMLRHAGCKIVGIAFIGDAEPEVEQTICDFGEVARLGRLPMIDDLAPAKLSTRFAEAIDLKPIQEALKI